VAFSLMLMRCPKADTISSARSKDSDCTSKVASMKIIQCSTNMRSTINAHLREIGLGRLACNLGDRVLRFLSLCSLNTYCDVDVANNKLRRK
jgi:hypothetical protein